MSCWQWASLFGETNVCDARDKAGFLIGLASIICWGLAEVPQLVANAAEGSSEGISEGLLWLWVFSDVLDVAGCSFADTVRESHASTLHNCAASLSQPGWCSSWLWWHS
jgi:hypothetical protein